MYWKAETDGEFFILSDELKRVLHRIHRGPHKITQTEPKQENQLETLANCEYTIRRIPEEQERMTRQQIEEIWTQERINANEEIDENDFYTPEYIKECYKQKKLK